MPHRLLLSPLQRRPSLIRQFQVPPRRTPRPPLPDHLVNLVQYWHGDPHPLKESLIHPLVILAAIAKVHCVWIVSVV